MIRIIKFNNGDIRIYIYMCVYIYIYIHGWFMVMNGDFYGWLYNDDFNAIFQQCHVDHWSLGMVSLYQLCMPGDDWGMVRLWHWFFTTSLDVHFGKCVWTCWMMIEIFGENDDGWWYALQGQDRETPEYSWDLAHPQMHEVSSFHQLHSPALPGQIWCFHVLGTPKSSIVMGFSLTTTIHCWIPPWLRKHQKMGKHPTIYMKRWLHIVKPLRHGAGTGHSDFVDCWAVHFAGVGGSGCEPAVLVFKTRTWTARVEWRLYIY